MLRGTLYSLSGQLRRYPGAKYNCKHANFNKYVFFNYPAGQFSSPEPVIIQKLPGNCDLDNFSSPLCLTCRGYEQLQTPGGGEREVERACSRRPGGACPWLSLREWWCVQTDRLEKVVEGAGCVYGGLGVRAGGMENVEQPQG